MRLRQRLSNVWTVLSQPVSRARAIIGLITGVITIGGTLLSITGLRPSEPRFGEVVAVVQDSRTQHPVAGAVVEVLSASNAQVSTLLAKKEGRARSALREGMYRLRVSHPGFTNEVRSIEVQAGRTAEIVVGLKPRPAPPPVAKTGQDRENAFKKFFRKLGF